MTEAEKEFVKLIRRLTPKDLEQIEDIPFMRDKIQKLAPECLISKK